MTARVPNWLKVEKGKPIRIIPERARLVKQMFRWAATGLGQYAICDKLIEAGVEPWGKPYKGMPARWTPFYISEILSSRSTIGEYQPHTKREIDGLKRRVPDGDPVSYYPAVVPLALFQKVQDVRRTFAQKKFGASFLAGKDLRSDKNQPISETGMECNRWIACFHGLPLCNDLTLSGHYPQDACPVAQVPLCNF